ncbi:MAG: Histone deacetylase-like amidohydrolase [bacterium]|nr:Histone deacetylase-like amidohydrolase [bacterium]
MRAALVHSPVFLDHDTGYHPECPDRLVAIDKAFREAGILDMLPLLQFEEATLEPILKIHGSDMVERVFDTAEAGGGFLDPDTVVCPESARVALEAVGGCLAACRAVLEGKQDRVLCLVRPPGHHATPSRSMGFCLFNNIAIAAQWLLESDAVSRVGIIDFDVHHGNGTQDAFYTRGDVFFLSLHQSPHYPGTGSRLERGLGEGEGRTLNFPMPPGVALNLWMDTFERGLDEVAGFDPQVVLVSAGFDGHKLDPLGAFPLDEDSFFEVGRRISELAGGRGVVSLLEGGYNLQVLGKSVVAYHQGVS